jgi:probable HAF family extracellular repeat protein
MRHKSSTHLSLGWALLVLLFCAALVGCSHGGTNSPSGSIPGASSYAGRVTAVVNLQMPATVLNSLTPAERAKLQANSVLVTAQGLSTPSRGIAGRWVQVGNQRAMTDPNGNFTIAVLPPGVTTGQIFRQFSDATPETTFPLSNLVPAGQTPPPTQIIYNLAAPGDMNPPGRAASRRSRDSGGPAGGTASDGCQLRSACPMGDNSVSCCLDYDGLGDGLPRQRTTDSTFCFVRAHLNFLRSTCYLWSFDGLTREGTVCGNESAYRSEGATGPGCWSNHKYRNCQNLKQGDITLTPATVSVTCGQTVTLHIHNNSPANETLLQFKEAEAGKMLALASDSRSAGLNITGFLVSLNYLGLAFQINHYNDSPGKHFEDVDVVYTAPATLPAGQPQAVYHLSAQADGVDVVTTITITCAPLDHIVPTSPTVAPGGIVTLTGEDKGGSAIPNADLTWTSSDATIASVDAGGTVTGGKAGMVTISAKQTSTGNIAHVPLTVQAIACTGGAGISVTGYSLTELKPINARYPAAINAYGEVVALGLWIPSIRNGTSGVYSSTAPGGEGINSAGHIAGGAGIWIPTSPNGATGASTNLGNFSAHGVNDSDVVVGETTMSDGTLIAALWKKGVVTILGTLAPNPRNPNQYDGSSSARGINNAGQVIGTSIVPGVSGAPDAVHAFLYSGVSPPMALRELPNTFTSAGQAINANGDAVGWSEIPSADHTHTVTHAILWRSGAVTDLSTLGGDKSYAYGINTYDVVVGMSNTASAAGGFHAFLYSGGRMVDLNDFHASFPDWVLWQALGINDCGQIIGYGTKKGVGDFFVLLTPK